jgi:hypothetical protein
VTEMFGIGTLVLISGPEDLLFQVNLARQPWMGTIGRVTKNRASDLFFCRDGTQRPVVCVECPDGLDRWFLPESLTPLIEVTFLPWEGVP